MNTSPQVPCSHAIDNDRQFEPAALRDVSFKGLFQHLDQILHKNCHGPKRPRLSYGKPKLNIRINSDGRCRIGEISKYKNDQTLAVGLHFLEK